MADDIIDIEDYEIKDTQIVESSQDGSDYDDTYSGNSSFNGYDENTRVYGFSGSLSDPKILILIMVVVLLIAIFIFTFE